MAFWLASSLPSFPVDWRCVCAARSYIIVISALCVNIEIALPRSFLKVKLSITLPPPPLHHISCPVFLANRSMHRIMIFVTHLSSFSSSTPSFPSSTRPCTCRQRPPTESLPTRRGPRDLSAGISWFLRGGTEHAAGAGEGVVVGRRGLFEV